MRRWWCGSTRITETGLAARNRRAGFPALVASVSRDEARLRGTWPALETAAAGQHRRAAGAQHVQPRQSDPSTNRRAVSFLPLALAALLFSLSTLSAQSNALTELERAAAANPPDVQAQQRLAAAYEAAGRRLDAAAAWTRVTNLAPQAPAGWYTLGLAYNAVAQEAVQSFEGRPADAVWRQLLMADSLLATGHLTDAFVIYRSVEEQLPSMVTIHESIAQIYERSGHAAWAAT